jgi:hypothetical protein
MATSIEETNKSTFVPDTTLNPLPPMDLSGIKASVDAITKSVADITAQYQKAGETKIEQPKEPAKTSMLDSVLGKKEVQQAVPTKTSADYIAEQQALKSSFLESVGINQETFDKRTELAIKMASLNQQLQQAELQEEKQKLAIQESTPWALSSSIRSQQAVVARNSYFQKAAIAAEITGLSAQYQIIQGNIEEANKFFEQAINYATAKEAQDVEDYRWALSFYTDLEKSDKDYLQQEFENKLKINADARAQKQFELDQIKANYSMTKDSQVKQTGYSSELNFALSQNPDNPEQAARDVWSQFGAEMSDKGITWEQVLAEAYSLKGLPAPTETIGTTNEEFSVSETPVYGSGNFSNVSINDRIAELQSMKFNKAMIRGQLKEDGYPESEINKKTGNIIDKTVQAGSDLLSWVSKLFK